MPLNELCRSYMGRPIFVLPYYGYGWTRPDLKESTLDPLASLGPEPFWMSFDSIVESSGELVGGSGIIKNLGHQYHEYWCCFYLRMTSFHDFTEHPGDYMIWISNRELLVEASPQRARYDWVKLDKATPTLCGYGTVSESVKWIQERFDRTMNSRKPRTY